MAKKQSKSTRKAAQEHEQTAQKSQAVPQVTRAAPQKKVPVAARGHAVDDRILFSVLGVLLFFLLAFQGGASDKVVGVGMAVVFIACSIGRGVLQTIRQRLSVPMLMVFGYVAMNAAAGLYARFGGFAASEFGKIFAAFSACAIVLLRLRRDNSRAFAAMLASVTAIFAVISIDASSLNLLSRAYVGVMDKLGCHYAGMTIGYEAGVRVTGLFGNANILGGILALGVFLSLALVYGAATSRARLGACMVLVANALGFLLTFSMGAIAMFVLSVIVYLVAAAKTDRLPLLVLMVETAVVVLAMTALAFPGLGTAGALAAVPVLAGPVGGIILWGLHRVVGMRLSTGISVHGKAAGIVIAAVFVLALGYVVAGYNLTGSHTFAPGETLRRAAYPAAGTYGFVTGGESEAITVTVESQNDSQTMMHTSTVLYEGPLAAGVSFTVPEDSRVVYFNLTAAAGATLDELRLTDGPQIPLGYRLLPGFIANRIQGLWANQNAIQRTVFFRDGMRIFAMSPIIGTGLGTVEGMVTGVQDFFYESRYVHNHYIQMLAEMGVIGLALFVGMLGTVAVTLFRRRREGAEGDGLLPALCACLAMMAAHGAVEAVWSLSVYQTVAMLILAATAVCYAKPIERLNTTAAAVITSAALWLFFAVFAWLLYGNISAGRTYQAVKSGQQQQTPYTMGELSRKDRYNWAQYELDMAVNAADSEVPEFRNLAAQYAARLRKLETHSINYSLALYHYTALGNWEQAFIATREGIGQSASRPESWQSLFNFYQVIYPGDSGTDARWFAQQSLMLYDMLQAHNNGRMEQIGLTEQNMAFIQQMQAIA